MQHSNKYIFIYSVVMVVVIAVSLTIVAVTLKPLQDDNIRIEKMQNILASVNVPIVEIPKKQVPGVYDKYIKTAIGVNNAGEVIERDPAKVFAVELSNELKKPAAKQILPVFIAVLNTGDSIFVVPLRGKGLWGPVWGYISFKNDFNTVYGVVFDHKGETPGLGAEINQDWFLKPFIGKQIFTGDGTLVSIAVVKGGAKPDDLHGVDAISGGTITSKGVEKMLFDNLTNYEAYFKKHMQK
jgi:Na+-transporting NADH:ubiquinone oxidoreductase subunit C